MRNAEALLVSKMHNHRFNIFLGSGQWNSAIGGIAHKLNEIEDPFLLRLNNAADKSELEDIMGDWIDQIRSASTFGNYQQKKFIADVAERIVTEIFNEGTDFNETRDSLTSIVLWLYDSQATDISEAEDPKLKKYQNSFLFGIQRDLMISSVDPDIDQFYKTVSSFLKSEATMASKLKIDLNKLENLDDKMLDQFIRML